MMQEDPIVQEVRQAREAHAKTHGYDIDAIAADLKGKEQQDPQRLVSRPPKKYVSRMKAS